MKEYVVELARFLCVSIEGLKKTFRYYFMFLKIIKLYDVGVFLNES